MSLPNSPLPFEPEDEPDASVPRLKRRTWVLVWAGIAVLGAGAAWFGLRMAAQPVRWQNVGYTVDSAFESTVTFDVFLYTEQPVVCHLRALNIQYAEVGVATQEVDPGLGAEQRFTTPVDTTERANTVIVDYCEVVG